MLEIDGVCPQNILSRAFTARGRLNGYPVGFTGNTPDQAIHNLIDQAGSQARLHRVTVFNEWFSVQVLLARSAKREHPEIPLADLLTITSLGLD